MYSADYGFWPVENLAELADGTTACGKVAMGGCSIFLGLQCDKVRYTYGGEEGNR
jgi:hypothetical protein